MPASPPSVVSIAYAGWRDMFRALRPMAWLFLVSLTFSLLVAAARELSAVQALAEAGNIGRNGVDLVFETLCAFVQVPLLIGMYRFVLLGESTSGYSFVGADRRSRRFFGYRFLLNLVMFTLGVFIPTDMNAPAMTALALVVVFVVVIVAVIVSLRLQFVFPATAIDVSFANLSDAFASTKGRSWRIFWLNWWVGAPVIALAICEVALMAAHGRLTRVDDFNIDPFLAASINMFWEAAYAAAVARLYRAAGEAESELATMIEIQSAPS